MTVLERLTQWYRQGIAAVQRESKLQKPRLASLQRSTRELVPVPHLNS